MYEQLYTSHICWRKWFETRIRGAGNACRVEKEKYVCHHEQHVQAEHRAESYALQTQEPGTYHTYREEVQSSCRSGHSSLWEAEEGSHEDSQAEAQLHP